MREHFIHRLIVASAQTAGQTTGRLAVAIVMVSWGLVLCSCSTARKAEYRARSMVRLLEVYDKLIAYAEDHETVVVEDFARACYPENRSVDGQCLLFEDIYGLGRVRVSFFEGSYSNRELLKPDLKEIDQRQPYKVIAHVQAIELKDGQFHFQVLLTNGDAVSIFHDTGDVQQWFNSQNGVFFYPDY